MLHDSLVLRNHERYILDVPMYSDCEHACNVDVVTLLFKDYEVVSAVKTTSLLWVSNGETSTTVP